MQLDYIDLKDLKPAPINVRKHGGDNVDDLLPSMRAIGLIQPLLVRKNCQGFEVVAGARRLKAANLLVDERREFESLPCAILEDGDDATAIAASLAENVARLPMDEIDQFHAFKALADQGRSVDAIASDFGVTDRLVKQRLALAGLLPAILDAYRDEEVDAQTLRILTMASAKQQRAWLKLHRSPKERAPQAWQLKAWLFGGEIPVSNAIFDLADYTAPIKSDLFGEEQYFTDAAKFWELQNKAIAEAAEELRQAGWADVIVMDAGQRYSIYSDFTKCKKKDGGKVIIATNAQGEVEIMEGWLENKEAARREREQAKQDGTYQPPVKTELTNPATTYCNLHRHAAVRVELLSHPQIALRLLLAHAIAGSALWRVEAEPQSANRNEATEASLAASKAQLAFQEEKAAILALIGLPERKSLTRSKPASYYDEGDMPFDLEKLFVKISALSDEDVLRVAAFVMAESLQQGTHLIDTLGKTLEVDMRNWWQGDDAFYALLRDKGAINVMLREIAGKRVADGNVTEPIKTQKQIIRNFAEGLNGRTKNEGWLPRYMKFPQKTYLKRS